jgi:lipoprotein-anchoring transpeptidase ErfK/SrfK
LLLAADRLAAQEQPKVSPAAIEDAVFSDAPVDSSAVSPMLVKLQILLDVAGVSPGVIDGRDGKNIAKAVAVFQTMHGLAGRGALNAQTWDALPKAPPLARYAITEADVRGPFIESVPEDYGEMAKLKALSYTSPLEMLGERFHMSEELLQALNPGADFSRAGTQITVAAVDKAAVTTPVARLVADKAAGQLIGFDAAGRIVVAYPATIGSPQTPSPTGTHKVKGVARNPVYHYRPDVNFKQGGNDKPLTIAAGPNNPVGLVWIDLSKPTYGIHGTPAPNKIDKAFSHGCVRLTNWDVLDLARLVKPGVEVTFK